MFTVFFLTLAVAWSPGVNACRLWCAEELKLDLLRNRSSAYLGSGVTTSLVLAGTHHDVAHLTVRPGFVGFRLGVRQPFAYVSMPSLQVPRSFAYIRPNCMHMTRRM